tara:strand:- start:316 stop:648 length:333 start_codon:yes stop_codon:yes gene_type:complete
LESITYQSKDLIEAIKADDAYFEKLMIDGGMVANDWFCQKLANILEVEVERPKIIETTSLGAAYLAGLSADLFENFGSLSKLRQVDKTFKPKKEDNNYLEWSKAVQKILT